MTEIIVSANKSINLKKSENSYYGESLADIFKLLIPYHINGILAENADISFCFATPAGNLEKISLNDYGFVATRLRSYLTFYFVQIKFSITVSARWNVGLSLKKVRFL